LSYYYRIIHDVGNCRRYLRRAARWNSNPPSKACRCPPAAPLSAAEREGSAASVSTRAASWETHNWGIASSSYMLERGGMDAFAFPFVQGRRPRAALQRRDALAKLDTCRRRNTTQHNTTQTNETQINRHERDNNSSYCHHHCGE